MRVVLVLVVFGGVVVEAAAAAVTAAPLALLVVPALAQLLVPVLALRDSIGDYLDALASPSRSAEAASRRAAWLAAFRASTRSKW